MGRYKQSITLLALLVILGAVSVYGLCTSGLRDALALNPPESDEIMTDYPSALDDKQALRRQLLRIRKYQRLLQRIELLNGLKLKARERESRKNPEQPLPVTTQMVFSTGERPEDHCMFYDGDADGDVDMSDFGYIQVCMSGEGVPYSDGQCERFDADFDGDVDSDDLNEFFACVSGPSIRYPGFLADRYHAVRLLKHTQQALLAAPIRDPLAFTANQRAYFEFFLGTSAEVNDKGMAVVGSEFFYPANHPFFPNVPSNGSLLEGASEVVGGQILYKLRTTLGEPANEVVIFKQDASPKSCTIGYASNYVGIERDIQCVIEQALAQAHQAGDGPNTVPDIAVNSRMQQGLTSYLLQQITLGRIQNYRFLKTNEVINYSPNLLVTFSPSLGGREAYFYVELDASSFYALEYPITEIAEEYNQHVRNGGFVLLAPNLFHIGQGSDLLEALSLLVNTQWDFRTRSIAALDIFRFGGADVASGQGQSNMLMAQEADEELPVLASSEAKRGSAKIISALSALTANATKKLPQGLELKNKSLPQIGSSNPAPETALTTNPQTQVTPSAYYDNLGGRVPYASQVAVFDIARWRRPSSHARALYQGLYMLEPFGYSIHHYRYSFVNTKMIHRLIAALQDDNYQIIYIIAHGGKAATGHEMLIECWDTQQKAEDRAEELKQQAEIDALKLEVRQGCGYYDPNVAYDQNPEWKTDGWGIWLSGLNLLNAGAHANRKGIVFNQSCYGGFCPSNFFSNHYVGVAPSGVSWETVAANDLKLFMEFWTTKREDPRLIAPWMAPGLLRTVGGTYFTVGTKYRDGAAYNAWSGAWWDDYDSYLKGTCAQFDSILNQPVRMFCLDRWAGGLGPELEVAPRVTSVSMNTTYRGMNRIQFNTPMVDCSGGFGEGCSAEAAIELDYSQCIADFETLSASELAEQYFDPFFTNVPVTLPLCPEGGEASGCREIFFKKPHWEDRSTISWAFNWENTNNYYVSIFDETKCNMLPPIKDCTTAGGPRILDTNTWNWLPRPPANEAPYPQPVGSNADWQKNWNRFLKIRVLATENKSWPAEINLNGNAKAGSGKEKRNIYGTHYYGQGSARQPMPYKAWQYYNAFDAPSADFEVWVPCQPPRIDYMTLCYRKDEWPSCE